ncbi:hypothetical protein Q8A67_008415 [Cirrhinus molitorella]|uniref:Uncharacterized protein n=1 Tax=Cirrhinus molitorella TaxID=172907 RepID=A0AA88U173_9TELE|nr:hypothetical protein Q8A67_008415 [Cirrhinus molitorella]
MAGTMYQLPQGEGVDLRAESGGPDSLEWETLRHSVWSGMLIVDPQKEGSTAKLNHKSGQTGRLKGPNNLAWSLNGAPNGKSNLRGEHRDDPAGQWQACEGLGGIKLQMRDLDKAAMYYKDALQLLCKCQDVTGLVQERLVSELSEALEQKLLLQQRGAASQRTAQEQHHTSSSDAARVCF